MENIFLGFLVGMIQGITEWLPISSSAAIVLFSNFFSSLGIEEMIRYALFLHLGTFLAAFIYFRKDIFSLTKKLFHYKTSDKKSKKVINFLIISTIITGAIGIIFLYLIKQTEDIPGNLLTLVIGLLLLITAIIQLKVKTTGVRKIQSLKSLDAVVLGFFQGLAVLPGISRSGITVSALLLQKFDDTTALKLSFLMSLPVVLGANILLNLSLFTFSAMMIYSLLVSFIFGILTIHGLMKLSKKINFGFFVLIFAILMILGGLIPIVSGI